MLWCPKCEGFGVVDGGHECNICENGWIRYAELQKFYPDLCPCPICHTERVIYRKGEYWPCERCDCTGYVRLTPFYRIVRNIQDFFFLTQPFRQILLHVYDFLPEHVQERWANRFFPEWLTVTFKGDE
jgi:hypothetical protein